jgi:hypothetical protein
MAVHWVNYDLNKTGQNYESLITYLKSHNGWAKPLKSSFLVATNLDVGELRTEIVKHVDSTDDVLVINVDSKSWASWGLSYEVNNWIKANVSG